MKITVGRVVFVSVLVGLVATYAVAQLSEIILLDEKNERAYRLSGEQEVTAGGGITTDAEGEVQVGFFRDMSAAVIRLKLKNAMDVTGVHLHCGRAGENGPIVFGLASPGPCKATDSGTECRLTNIDWVGADCNPVVGATVNNIASLFAAIRQDLIYLNVHTVAHPSGELRAQIFGR